MHNSITSASIKTLDLSLNHTPLTNQPKTKELGKYTLNVTNNFKTNGSVTKEIKVDVSNVNSDISDNKVTVDSVSEKIAKIDPTISEPQNEFKEIELKLALEDNKKNNSGRKSRNEEFVDEDTLLNDDEPIAFTEESLKAFESTGLTREENKIIEAFEDTISGYVNAAFDDNGDPLDEDNAAISADTKADPRPDSRSSSTSNQSGSDKPGIIVSRHDSDVRKLKRPNSVSFQLPENHIDKQTTGRNYNTLAGGPRATGYKRVLSSQFYSYRPNSYSAWAMSDLPKHNVEKERVPTHVLPRKTESLSKKNIGPFNASFSEWIRKKQGSVKLKPAQQNGAVKTDTDVSVNIPTQKKRRATILNPETAKLISTLEANVGDSHLGRHIERDYKLKEQPYVVQEIGSGPNSESEKGDRFLY